VKRWLCDVAVQCWDDVVNGYRDARNPRLCRAVRAFAASLNGNLIDTADIRALAMDERTAVLSVLYKEDSFLDKSRCESSCAMLARLLSGWWRCVLRSSTHISLVFESRAVCRRIVGHSTVHREHCLRRWRRRCAAAAGSHAATVVLVAVTVI
jgi:hypothetical protein